MDTQEKDNSLEALISRASELVAKVSKSEGDSFTLRRLQPQAAELINALDRIYPHYSLLQRTWAITRQVAIDPQRSRHLVQEAADIAQHESQTRQLPVRREFTSGTTIRQIDVWILDLLRATQSAIPREKLVSDFVERYKKLHGMTDTSKNNGTWLFVFEDNSDDVTDSIELRALNFAGVYKETFEHCCMELLPDWRQDIFLSHVFQYGRDIDGWYALPMGGSPLFDALLQVKAKFKRKEPDYWVNAVALPGDRRYPNRGIFILYRNMSALGTPEPPPGQPQDMRILTALSLTWRQLEHQIRSLATLGEADRRSLINLIGPGLLHHEIGFTMRTAYAQAYELFHLLHNMHERTRDKDVELAARYAHGTATLVHKLYSITDVFNNLDKRSKVEEKSLHAIFGDLKLLLNHRLSTAGVHLYWDEERFASEALITDVVLFTHALLNLINNAINAFESDDAAPENGNSPSEDQAASSIRRIYIYLAETDEESLTLVLTNNGPPIPPGNAEDIFRRGFTTRQDGHGQGLYLARLVSHYLGGNLELMEKEDLPDEGCPPFRVGFRFSLNRKLVAQKGVAHAAPA